MVSTSDGNGIYEFNALPPAPYRITVEHAGFKQKVLEHVQIIPSSSIRWTYNLMWAKFNRR